MEKRLITGNEAVALGALRAGVRVATGYPGTPSTGCLASLLEMELPGRHVEWSVNEKVALEVAAGAAWAGQRALCTMKMSGVNVAYDSLCSIAYSGTVGGLVIYVADDPGASAGMVEQDSRGFALMTDLPMLDPGTVAEAYTLVQAAFELSERTAAPVFLRLVASVANSYAPVEVEEPLPPAERSPVLSRDIARFTKAGAAICMAQHRDTLARLEHAGQVIRALGLNRLYLAPRSAPLDLDSHRAIKREGPVVVQPVPGGGQPHAEGLPQYAVELLRQAQDLLNQAEQAYLPDRVQEILRQAGDALGEAQQRLACPPHETLDVLRLLHEVLLRADEALGQAQEVLPQAQHPLRQAQELLQRAQQALSPG